MRFFWIYCILTIFSPSFCFAGLFSAGTETKQLTNPTQITIIIPNDKEVDSTNIRQINFTGLSGGSKEKHYTVSVKGKTDNSFKVESRVDNGFAGSGIVYELGYSFENNPGNTELKVTPKAFHTYQQGFISFSVPTFTEKDLAGYIIRQPVFYNLELDSPYNTESTYANFARLVKKASIRIGETDPVTGKIFKEKFVIPYKDGQIYFTLETFPYRNGSKAVMHMVVPGSLTSDNVVDFGILLKEIKSQLEAIVNS